MCRDLVGNRKIGTVYIGGGTPSVLSSIQFKRMLSCIKTGLPLTSVAEWTVEANPSSLSNAHIFAAKDAGVDRFSLGVQSFSDDVLTFLGRPHSAQDALKTIEMVRDAGFTNLGMDLIYGIPNQTEGQWDETITRAIALKPQHISVYSLSVDDGALFAVRARKGEFRLPQDECVAFQYERAQERLINAGYEQYEISNFALPGFACRHNLNYWSRGEYVGLGPAAWSFSGNRRYGNVADVNEYCRRLERGESTVEHEEAINLKQAEAETIMLTLRTVRGLDLFAYGNQFGQRAGEHLKKASERFVQQSLLEVAAGRLRLTSKGFLLSNEVLQGLLP